MSITQLGSQQELHNALINNEFVLHYQPQFHLGSSAFTGVEALIRWQHPQKGLVFPKDFLPLAEQCGLIIPIGKWVLRTACSQFKLWQDKGLSPIRIAVNVSGKQFEQEDFVDYILKTLQEIKLLPQCLELELSENIILKEDDKIMIQMVQQLSHAGVSIALDDFGMGHSGIHYLRRIPVDRIKIDKTYVQRLDTDKTYIEKIKSLIELATNLHLEIVAEGVETLKQLQALASQNCKEVQGYYFSEPVSADKLENFLETYK